MNNKEKYKEAFSVVRIPDNFSVEVEKMEKNKKLSFKPAIAVALVCIMLVGSGTVAYAADLGGIQRTVQIWLNGDQTDATIEFDGNGHYEMEYTDKDGNKQTAGGGGVAFDDNGNEIPLSEEELMAELNAPNVQYEDNGKVFVYWYDQKVEITDKFDENGVCYVKLDNGIEKLYLTVEDGVSYSISNHKFLKPTVNK